MEYFFAWIFFAFVVGGIGSSRRIGFAGAFFASLLLSPLIGIILVFASSKDSTIAFQKKLLEQQKQIADNNGKGKPDSQSSKADELRKLATLKDEGVITQEEFEVEKSKILAR